MRRLVLVLLASVLLTTTPATAGPPKTDAQLIALYDNNQCGSQRACDGVIDRLRSHGYCYDAKLWRVVRCTPAQIAEDRAAQRKIELLEGRH